MFTIPQGHLLVLIIYVLENYIALECEVGLVSPESAHLVLQKNYLCAPSEFLPPMGIILASVRPTFQTTR